jgi:hypothetical protein
MNRRTTIMLAGIMLSGLAIAALPQFGFAQSSPLIGTWKLNVQKSNTPGPPPRSVTMTYQQDGQNIKNTLQGTDAQGNPIAGVLMHVYDGQPHPSTGTPNIDSSAYTRIDANTFIFSRLKAGKLVATGNGVISQDGKTLTLINSTTGTNGNSIAIYEKQ